MTRLGKVACTVGHEIPTPAGVVTVSAGGDNVVTVQLAPAKPGTLLFALPFAIPPGPPARSTPPNLVVISIHPPSPCRVAVNGNTAVFTPVLPPAPPT